MKRPIARRRRAVFIWLALTAVVLAILFFFSSQSVKQSDAVSRGLLKWILNTFFGGAGRKQIHRWDTPLRKAAHFTIFFFLGICLTGALRHQKRLPSLPTAIGAAAVFAALDELHQRFVEGRAPQLSDVALDVCGAAAGAILLAAILRLLADRKK